MILLTHEEINDLEAFIKGLALTPDPITNEYRSEQLLILCRMARLCANDADCLHFWEKDGIVTRCAKCGAMP